MKSGQYLPGSAAAIILLERIKVLVADQALRPSRAVTAPENRPIEVPATHGVRKDDRRRVVIRHFFRKALRIEAVPGLASV